MDVLKAILGAEDIISTYGYWPSFHDDEISEIRMHEKEGITIVIRTTTRPNDWTENPIIEFHFSDIDQLEFIDWYSQNVIFELKVTKEEENIKISFDASVGHGDLFAAALELEQELPTGGS